MSGPGEEACSDGRLRFQRGDVAGLQIVSSRPSQSSQSMAVSVSASLAVPASLAAKGLRIGKLGEKPVTYYFNDFENPNCEWLTER